MDLNEVIAAIGGPVADSHRPEGGSNVQPLSPLGLDRPGGESAPSTVAPQQGAGSTGYLTPGSSGTAAAGAPVKGWKGAGYEDQGGPQQLPTLSGIEALTAGGNFGGNRPSPDGAAPTAAPVSRPDTALGRDQSTGQLLNPALKAALSPRPGPFGPPSTGEK